MRWTFLVLLFAILVCLGRIGWCDDVTYSPGEGWTIPADLQQNQEVTVTATVPADADATIVFEDVKKYSISEAQAALQPPAVKNSNGEAQPATKQIQGKHRAKGDELDIRITGLTPVPTASIPVYGRWVYLVTTGLVVSTLRDYKFVDQGGTLGYDGTQDDFSAQIPTTLVHFYKTSPKEVSWTDVLGVTPGDSMRLYYGRSKITGDANRWAISGGVAFGRLDGLNSDHTATHKVWQAGAFLSVTYRLFD